MASVASTVSEPSTWLKSTPATIGRFTLRGGYKWIKLQLQLGKSTQLSSGELKRDSGMFSIALSLDLFRAFDGDDSEDATSGIQ